MSQACRRIRKGNVRACLEFDYSRSRLSENLVVKFKRHRAHEPTARWKSRPFERECQEKHKEMYDRGGKTKGRKVSRHGCRLRKRNDAGDHVFDGRGSARAKIINYSAHSGPMQVTAARFPSALRKRDRRDVTRLVRHVFETNVRVAAAR